MSADNRHKLRLRYPSGAEFEAEGSIDFILSEKNRFIGDMEKPGTKGGQDAENIPAKEARPAKHEIWQKIAAFKQNILILTTKSPLISKIEAGILIIAAAQALGPMPGYPAVRLAKSMRISGYQPERMDRLLVQAIKEGKITASGMKRNRIYSLAPKGMAEAFSIAHKVLPE